VAPKASDRAHNTGQAKEAGMVNYISILVFIIVGVVGAVLAGVAAQVNPSVAVGFGFVWLVLDIIFSSGIKMAAQWEKAVVFRMGKFSSIKGPGLFFIIPLVDQARFIDTRVLTMDIPTQQVITKDNVPVRINGVLFFQVRKVDDAIIKVQDYRYAISQYAQTSLRDVIGQMTLDQLLGEREEIGKAIEANVEKDTEEWGLEVKGIRIQDIDMPEDLKRMMSRQASAEREKRATITKAEGDRDAAMNLAAAARTMAESPGAMQLRTLQSIDGLGPSASNTVVLAVPVDVMETVRGLSTLLKDRKPAVSSVGQPSAGVRTP
jgi:regulator of protease activity HflC (stomatin/prohibitin superfamily)